MASTAPAIAAQYSLPPVSYKPRKARPLRSDTANKIELADLTANNSGQLRKLNSVLFPVRFGEKWYKDVLGDDSKEVCKFALFNDIPVANVCCKYEREGKNGAKLYIMTLGCLAPYRRLGIASKLLSHILDVSGPGKAVSLLDLNAPTPKPVKNKEGKDIPAELVKEERVVSSVYLHVQTDNEEAKAFYLKHGFEETQMLSEYYKVGIEPRSAWVLEKRESS